MRLFTPALALILAMPALAPAAETSVQKTESSQSSPSPFSRYPTRSFDTATGVVLRKGEFAASFGLTPSFGESKTNTLSLDGDLPFFSFGVNADQSLGSLKIRKFRVQPLLPIIQDSERSLSIFPRVFVNTQGQVEDFAIGTALTAFQTNLIGGNISFIVGRISQQISNNTIDFVATYFHSQAVLSYSLYDSLEESILLKTGLANQLTILDTKGSQFTLTPLLGLSVQSGRLAASADAQPWTLSGLDSKSESVANSHFLRINIGVRL